MPTPRTCASSWNSSTASRLMKLPYGVYVARMAGSFISRRGLVMNWVNGPGLYPETNMGILYARLQNLLRKNQRGWARSAEGSS